MHEPRSNPNPPPPPKPKRRSDNNDGQNNDGQNNDGQNNDVQNNDGQNQDMAAGSDQCQDSGINSWNDNENSALLYAEIPGAPQHDY